MTLGRLRGCKIEDVSDMPPIKILTPLISNRKVVPVPYWSGSAIGSWISFTVLKPTVLLMLSIVWPSYEIISSSIDIRRGIPNSEG